MLLFGMSLLVNIIFIYAMHDMSKDQPDTPYIECDNNKWREVAAAQMRGLQRQARNINRLKKQMLLMESVNQTISAELNNLKGV